MTRRHRRRGLGLGRAWSVDDSALRTRRTCSPSTRPGHGPSLAGHDLLDFAAAVQWTVDWARRVSVGEDSALDVTRDQIDAFTPLGRVDG